MQSLVDKWLKGSQNFIVGRILYTRLAKDNSLCQQLGRGETAANKKLLSKAMKQLLNPPVEEPVIEPSDITFFDKKKNDDVLRAMNNEWNPFYKRLQYLLAVLDGHGELNTLQAIAVRETIAFEILDLEDKCEEIWAKRDFYLKHGTLPEVDEKEFEIPTDPKELAKLLQNIPRNIRRNRLKMQQPGAKALYAHLYERYKDLYKQITGNDYVEKD